MAFNTRFTAGGFIMPEEIKLPPCRCCGGEPEFTLHPKPIGSQRFISGYAYCKNCSFSIKDNNGILSAYLLIEGQREELSTMLLNSIKKMWVRCNEKHNPFITDPLPQPKESPRFLEEHRHYKVNAATDLTDYQFTIAGNNIKFLIDIKNIPATSVANKKLMLNIQNLIDYLNKNWVD
jgi:hypothetical protein